MKKIYFLVASILSSMVLNAQENTNGPTTLNLNSQLSKSIYQPREMNLGGSRCTQNIIYSETFSNPFSNGWTRTGAGSSLATYSANQIWLHDLDGPNGNFSDPSEIISSSSVNDGFLMLDGDYFNGLGGPPLTVESFQAEAVSPVYNLNGYANVSVKFEHSFRICCSSAQNHLFLDVSTDGFNNTAATFILDADIPVNDGSGLLTEYINITNAIAGNPANTQIRFRWGISGSSNNASHYYWQIDDLEIYETYQHHANLDSLNWTADLTNFGYFGGFQKIPSHAAANTTLTWSAYLENIGYSNWTDAKLNVLQNGVPFAQSTAQTVTNGSFSSRMEAGAQMPSSIGTYSYSIFGTDTAQMCIMDTMEVEIEVTQDAYSTGGSTITGVQSGSNWVWQTPPVRVGFGGEVISTCSTTETIVGIRVAFQDTSINNQVPMEAIILVNGTQVASELFTVDPSFYGARQPVAFTTPVVINSGDVVDYLIVDNDGEARFLEGAQYQNVIGLLVTFDGSSTMSGPYLEAPIIAEMVVCEDTANCAFLGVKDLIQSDKISSLDQNIPNPFDQNTRINFNLKSNEPCTFTIRDLAGKVVKEMELGIQSAGQNQIQLDANEFSEGVYFYTLTAGGESLTKKMVVVK
ncbi:MAG: T9SS type A sorting domain-containing protein [Crocinitomicaceae bacterium]|nr:T9SS type A sorting domain-containing protein [Crocinitomicaceae bacterium]